MAEDKKPSRNLRKIGDEGWMSIQKLILPQTRHKMIFHSEK